MAGYTFEKDKQREATVFVSKYALTRGLFQISGTVTRSHNCEYFSRGRYWLKLSKDCWLTRDEAEAAAKKMAARRIVNLQDAINRMRGLEQDPLWIAKEVDV